MTTRAQWMLWSLLAIACGPVEPPPPPGTDDTIEAAGSGETNAEPLWPVAPGQQFDGLLVRDPVRFGPYTALPFSSVLPYQYGDGPSPELPGKASYFSVTPQGDVRYVGDSRRGPLAVPCTWLPAKVRDGMRWSTGRTADGGPRFVVRVVSHRRQPTLVGQRMVWHLDVLDREAYGPTSRNDGLERGFTFVWLYAEGLGPLSNERGAFTHVRAWLNPGPAPAPLEKVPAKPVATQTPLTSDFLARWLSVVEGPSLPRQLGSVGSSATIAQANFMGGITGRSDDASLCATFAGGTATDCRSAAATVLASSSELVELSANGLTAGPARMCPGCASTRFNAIWKKEDGGVQVGDLSGEKMFVGDWAPVGGQFGVANLEARAPALAIRAPRFANTLVWATGRATFVVPDGPQTHWLSLSADGEAVTRPGPRVPPTLGFHAGPQGLDVLLAFHDGRVEELRATAEGLRIDTLFDVGLPDGHTLMAAVRSGDAMWLVSSSGFRGRDAQLSLTGFDPARLPDNGSASLFEVPNTPAVASRAPSPLDSMQAWAQGNELAVCWHGADGATPVGAWSLGGAPARVLWAAGTSCALVVREPSANVVDELPGSFALEGEFSVGGRFVYAESAQVLREGESQRARLTLAGLPVAALSGGGFVGSAEFGAGLVPTRVLKKAVTGECQADRGGHGLWCGNRLIGRGGERVIAGFDGGAAIVQGGGVLAGATIYSADGGSRPVNLSGADAGFKPEAVLSDGVVLGRSEVDATVTAVSMGQRRWTSTERLAELVSFGRRACGRTLAQTPPSLGLTCLDVETGAAQSWEWSAAELLGPSPWPAPRELRWAVTPSGRAFIVASQDRTVQHAHVVFELTNGGPVRLEVPRLRALGTSPTVELAADDQSLVLWPTGEAGQPIAPNSIVRHPLTP